MASNSKRPLPQGERFFTADATGLRRAVERRSAVPMAYLFTQVPRWVPPVVLVVLLLTGLAVASPVGGVAALVVLVFLVWLAYLSWPSLRPGGKVLRVAVAVFVALLAATRFGLIPG
ncbi:DUF6703 family protein [Nonomuraea sp. NPDC050783]|uniref:DUF6703 family protein n=1 Tax=Nonomuraea sp. NPDC050783 TaxID=3154634 RepID=UPI0034667B5C